MELGALGSRCIHAISGGHDQTSGHIEYRHLCLAFSGRVKEIVVTGLKGLE